jgi:2-phospho-L-lactate guanylyltransferase
MLLDVARALSAARDASRVIVYTASRNVMEAVAPFGFEVIQEPEVEGHSAAVNRILPDLLAVSERVLVIASDLPYLHENEVDRVLTMSCSSVVILPSRDGTGTNGLVVTPGSRIRADYGDGSFQRHWTQAASTGAHPPVVCRLSGIAFDIDTDDDLSRFRQAPRRDSETWRFLEQVR